MRMTILIDIIFFILMSTNQFKRNKRRMIIHVNIIIYVSRPLFYRLDIRSCDLRTFDKFRGHIERSYSSDDLDTPGTWSENKGK